MAEAKVLTDNEKRQNFVKYCNIRLGNAVKAIELLGNLANKRAYDYSKDDVTKINKHLNDAIREMKVQFEAKTKSRSGNFITE